MPSGDRRSFHISFGFTSKASPRVSTGSQTTDKIAEQMKVDMSSNMDANRRNEFFEDLN